MKTIHKALDGYAPVWKVRLAIFRSLAIGALIALLLSGLSLLLGPGPRASAMAEHSGDGYVYVLNNNQSGSNSISVFRREEDGSLTLSSATSIGGLGSVTAFADGTQGSLILAHDEEARLFAVDAGSDQISVVNVHDGQLSVAGVFPSGGSGPVSLTYQDDLLYVLNAANGRTQASNVAGFHVDNEGTLHPIPGSTRPLSAPHPNAAQVQIDPSGRFLLVSEKGTNLIDVYHIRDDGSLSAATTFPSVGAVPFGMAFDPAGSRNELIVSDAAGGPNLTGAATAYRLAHGTPSLVSGPIPDHQIAPCWLVITFDGRFAYTSNADSQTISGYNIHSDGTIALLNANGATATTPPATFPLEEALSNNSRFLYVLDSRLLLVPPGPATLIGYQIHSDGSLSTVVHADQFVLPFSAIGLAAE
ncbi:MAG TPA: beta-propeller fold lactonase family protein [Ktedonobacteraceae bacterium]|nr:beta-propeller fold lactonase family protein [Ktedonobacteraceae bacterium]